MNLHLERTVYEPIPDGPYIAKIKEITAETGKFGDQFKFLFELEDADLDGRKLSGWCGARFSLKSKLYLWTEAAMGPIPNDAGFDSEALIGKRVRLTVLVKTSDKGEDYNTIIAVKPIGGKASSKPAPSRMSVSQAIPPAKAAAAREPVDDVPPEPEFDDYTPEEAPAEDLF